MRILRKQFSYPEEYSPMVREEASRLGELADDCFYSGKKLFSLLIELNPEKAFKRWIESQQKLKELALESVFLSRSEKSTDPTIMLSELALRSVKGLYQQMSQEEKQLREVLESGDFSSLKQSDLFYPLATHKESISGIKELATYAYAYELEQLINFYKNLLSKVTLVYTGNSEFIPIIDVLSDDVKPIFYLNSKNFEAKKLNPLSLFGNALNSAAKSSSLPHPSDDTVLAGIFFSSVYHLSAKDQEKHLDSLVRTKEITGTVRNKILSIAKKYRRNKKLKNFMRDLLNIAELLHGRDHNTRFIKLKELEKEIKKAGGMAPDARKEFSEDLVRSSDEEARLAEFIRQEKEEEAQQILLKEVLRKQEEEFAAQEEKYKEFMASQLHQEELRKAERVEHAAAAEVAASEQEEKDRLAAEEQAEKERTAAIEIENQRIKESIKQLEIARANQEASELRLAKRTRLREEYQAANFFGDEDLSSEPSESAAPSAAAASAAASSASPDRPSMEFDAETIRLASNFFTNRAPKYTDAINFLKKLKGFVEIEGVDSNAPHIYFSLPGGGKAMLGIHKPHRFSNMHLTTLTEIRKRLRLIGLDESVFGL